MKQRLNPEQRDALSIVLEDDLLQFAQEAAELRVFREWKDATTVEERELLHAECLALGRVTTKLRRYADKLNGDEDG